jgi:hypothetical protein
LNVLTPGRLAIAITGLLLAACNSTESSGPSAAASSTPSATASATSNRVTVSNAMIGAADTRAFLLFKLPADARLRGISWDGAINGLFSTSGSFGLWSGQSPDGRYVIIDGQLYDRHGQPLGPLPWPGKGEVPTWSADGKLICDAVPTASSSGSPMRLQVANPGKAARTVATGFTIYSDNASYPVLACDPSHDRAIVAFSPQGVAPAHLWVLRLSTGAVTRSLDTRGWATVSSDGSMLALSSANATGTWRTVIERIDDGSVLGTSDDFAGHGFSADGALLVGTSGAGTTVLQNWRTGRRLWQSSNGPYGGYRAEPSGSHMAIGLGFVGGSSQADVYIVASDGSSVLLPEQVQVALEY